MGPFKFSRKFPIDLNEVKIPSAKFGALGLLINSYLTFEKFLRFRKLGLRENGLNHFKTDFIGKLFYFPNC